MAPSASKNAIIYTINDFFEQYHLNSMELGESDIEEIIECIYIIASETEKGVTREEIEKLVNIKIKVQDPIYSEKDLEKLSAQIAELKKIKQPEQRTEEWYEYRRNRLTASDLATAIGMNAYGNRNELIASKCGYVKSFKPGAAIIHGVKFEPVATKFYEVHNDVVIHEYGCVPHPTIGHFGASPDGIVDPASNNRQYIGRMLEIKCPKSRELNGFVPEYYELQIQGQLEVCDLEYCDYLECDIKECDPEEFYSLSEDKFKGIVFEVFNNETRSTEYTYKYDDLDRETVKTWAHDYLNKIILDDKYEYIGLTYWYINNFDIILVKRDQERFAEIKKKIDEFWDEVLKHREIGYEPLLSKKKYTKVATKPAEIKHSFIESD
jgi:putative phage-type endonuclease